MKLYLREFFLFNCNAKYTKKKYSYNFKSYKPKTPIRENEK
jgi:hypothetical protein